MRRILLLLVVSIGLVQLPSSAARKRTKPKTPEDLLQQKVEKFTISTTLKQALQRYAKLADVKIEVDWAALRRTGVKEDRKVALKVTEATIAQLLDLTLNQVAKSKAPLSWYVDDKNVVRVTTQIRALYRDELLRASPMIPSPKRRRVARPSVATAFNFDNMGVNRVIDYFRDLSGVNITVNWASLEQVGITRDAPVSLKVRNVSIARALDLVTDQLSAARGRLDRVYWVVDRGVVTIATGAALNNDLRVRTYDVSDLLMVIPSVPRGELQSAAPRSSRGRDSDSRDRGDTGASLFLGGGEDREATGESRQQQRMRAEENLMAVIRDSIGPDMWEPIGKGRIRIFRNMLIVSQTPLGFKLLSEATRRR